MNPHILYNLDGTFSLEAAHFIFGLNMIIVIQYMLQHIEYEIELIYLFWSIKEKQFTSVLRFPCKNRVSDSKRVFFYTNALEHA